MNEFVEMRNSKAAQTVIKALEKRHMEGYYAATKEEACRIALSLIPEGSSVCWGGSISAQEIGLMDAVKNGNYVLLDRDAAATPEERQQIMRQGFSADVFLMGTNAISEDGQLVNIDGNGNRVAALVFGPKSVIVIAGMNKLTKTLEEAVGRARSIAAPMNAQRFQIETPCKHTGTCADCTSDDCICASMVITRKSMHHGRIKVILVGESLGF